MEDKNNYILFRAVPTMRCNYRCNYCFVSTEEKSTTKTMFDEHTPDEWISAMKNFADYQVEFYFWGGEPFLLDGTYEVVRGWTQYDHVISGSRIDTNMAFMDKIVERCPTDKLKLNCSWHPQYDSLEQIYKKVGKLNDLNMVGITNFVASQDNLKVLQDKYHLSIDELVKKFDDIGVFLNVAADFLIVNDRDPSTYTDYKRMILKYLCPEDWKQLRCEKSACFCQANHHYFTINANGDITPCLSGQVCGNFFDGMLQLPDCVVCDKKCPSLVSYCFRTDNNFPYKRHLIEYVNRNREYRKSVCSSKSLVSITYNDSIVANQPATCAPPSVSIVLPTYNHLKFLPKAIESVLAQTYDDFELIIVNDGSTDGTREYLDSLQDRRIRVIHQENKRLPEALNTGFRTARGELLTWISSDNYCAPMFLEKFVSAMDANPNAGLAYSTFARIDEHDQITGEMRCPDMDYRRMLLNFPGMASFMYRRICQEKVGLYDPGLEGSEDWDMWLRIVEQFQTVYIPEILYYYRRHKDSMTEKTPKKVSRASLQTFQNAINRLSLESLYPSLGHCKDQATAKFHAWFDFGTVLVHSKYGLQTGAACKFLEKALSLRSDLIEVAGNLAVAYALSEQWEKVVPLVRRILKDAQSPKFLGICRPILEAYKTNNPKLLLSTPLFEVDKNNSELFQPRREPGRGLPHGPKVTSETPSSENIDEKDSDDTPLDYFLKAKEEFDRGNFVTAIKHIEEYKSLMDYSKLPRILNTSKENDDIAISVIIVTYERNEDLKKCLESLSKQDCVNCNFEVIVVDNGQSDINSFKQYVDQYVNCPINFNLSEGRNIGAYFARGEIIVFLDDDALVGTDYISSIKSAFDKFDIFGLRGRAYPKNSPATNDHVNIYDLGDRPFPSYCNQEGNSAFLLEVYKSMGGMDPLLFGHEGSDLTYRIIKEHKHANKIIYWPETIIYHDYGTEDKCRQKKRIHQQSANYLKYKHDSDIFVNRRDIEKYPLPLKQNQKLLDKDSSAQVGLLSRKTQFNRESAKAPELPNGKSADIISAASVSHRHPKVSIVVSCHNSEKFLPECLDSIRNQTMQDWELFLLDDASTDGTTSIIEKYSRMNKRIKPHYFQDNKGPYVRRNFAMERAGSDFIIIQDADDIMVPSKLEVLYNAITSDERLGVVGSFYQKFLDEFRGFEYADRIELPITHDEIMGHYCSARYVCWHGSAIIRKTMFEAIGLYDEHPYGSDKLWLAKAAEYARYSNEVRFKNIPEFLTLRRMHPASQTGLLPSFDHRSRRTKFVAYWKDKFLKARERLHNNPDVDIKAELRKCKCSDFIEKHSHLFAQWESEPLDNKVLSRLVGKAVESFNSGKYVTCITQFDGMERMQCDIANRFKNYDLLRAMAYFAIDRKQESLSYLNREIQNHNNPAARQFISDYFENQLKTSVQNWCLENNKRYNLRMINVEGERDAREGRYTVSDRPITAPMAAEESNTVDAESRIEIVGDARGVLVTLEQKYKKLPDKDPAKLEIADKLTRLYHKIGLEAKASRFQIKTLKIKNSLEFERAKVSKPSVCRHKPVRVEFQVINRCNARCIMCGYGPEGEHFDLDRFKQIADEVLPEAKDVLLIGGEVLMHPNFYEICEYTNRYGISLDMTTNLYSLANERAEAIRNFFSDIRVSIDGATKQTYEGIRTALSFDKLQKNLEMLSEIKRHSRLRLSWEFVAMRQNIQELPTAVEMACCYGFDNMTVGFVHVHEKVKLEDSLLFNRELANKYFDLAREKAKEMGLHLNTPSNFDLSRKPYLVPYEITDGYKKCVAPWERVRIFSNGKLIPCCHLGLSPGNVFDAHFTEIWNGQKYRELRNAIREGSADMPDRCKHCQLAAKRTNSNDAMLHISSDSKSIAGMQAKLEEVYGSEESKVVSIGPVGRPRPKVSIIMSCYNSEKFLPECLDSIRNQTMKEWELFLLDDASTDGTTSIIEKYSRMDERIKAHYFQDNKGPYVRRNFAIERANSDFIVIQDADDIMCPTKLETLYNEITKNERLGVVGSFYQMFLDEFKGLEYADRIELPIMHDEIMERYCSTRYVCWHGSAIIRKTMFEAIGLYDEHPYGSDKLWLAKMAEYARWGNDVRLKNVPEYLTLKREHPLSQQGLLPTLDPRSRRTRFQVYWEYKLAKIQEKLQNEPTTDLAAELRSCDCSDYIERFGYMFEQWESEPLDDEHLHGFISKGIREFCIAEYASCIITLNSVQRMVGDVTEKFRNYDLLWGLANFALDRKEQCEFHIKREIKQHYNPKAEQFLNKYLNDSDAAGQLTASERGVIINEVVFDIDEKQLCAADGSYDRIVRRTYNLREAAQPRLSIVIVASGNRTELLETLSALNNQSDNRFEAIVIDSVPDETFEAQHVADKPAYGLSVIELAQKTSTILAKNISIYRAKGDYVAFLAEDAVPDRGLVGNIISHFENSNVSGLRGRILSKSGVYKPEYYDPGDRAVCNGCDTDEICAFRRDILVEVGGFTENLYGNESLELSCRIYEARQRDIESVMYFPDVIVYRRAYSSEQEYTGRMFIEERLRYEQIKEMAVQKSPQMLAYLDFSQRLYPSKMRKHENHYYWLVNNSLLLQERCPEEAVVWAEKAVSLEPEVVEGRYMLGLVYVSLGKYSEAQQQLEPILAPLIQMLECGQTTAHGSDLKPAVCYVDTCTKLAQCYMKQGKYDKLKQIFTHLLNNPHIKLPEQQRTAFCALLAKLEKSRPPAPVSKPALSSPTIGTDQQPLVSVIIPAYNAERYVAETIKSVLNQSYKNFELVVVNDGSIDQTKDIVLSFQDERIKYLYQENRGLASAHNVGIKNSKGNFLIKLDSDDMMTPDFIVRHLVEFRGHPEADLVYCDDYLIDEEGKPIRVIERPEYSDRKSLIRDLFRCGFPVVPFRTCIRRGVFDKIGFFDEDLQMAEDYDMMRRFVKNGLKIHHLKGALYLRRMTSDSLSRNFTAEKAKSHFDVVKRFTETFTYDELFPDVAWDKIAPERRQLHAECLAGVTYLAIGQTYVKTNSPIYAKTAFGHACSELNNCLKMDPGNQRIRQLLQKCEFSRQKYDEEIRQAVR